ncbi:hypothetical protein HER21_12890 [Pseudomonas sp. BGM005]|nr:hypothetical protein [Pseudomonas sp. BG5]
MAPLEYLNPDIGILRKWDEEVSPYTDVAASLRYLRLLRPCKAADFALLRPFLIKAAGKSNHLSVLLFQLNPPIRRLPDPPPLNQRSQAPRVTSL